MGYLAQNKLHIFAPPCNILYLLLQSFDIIFSISNRFSKQIDIWTDITKMLLKIAKQLRLIRRIPKLRAILQLVSPLFSVHSVFFIKYLFFQLLINLILTLLKQSVARYYTVHFFARTFFAAWACSLCLRFSGTTSNPCFLNPIFMLQFLVFVVTVSFFCLSYQMLEKWSETLLVFTCTAECSMQGCRVW